MSKPAADLQTPRLTVKQVAKVMNVSERSIYIAAAVIRLRPDLAEKVDAGEMSLHAAYGLATSKGKPTSWDRLVRAWNSATDDDRDRLALQIIKQRPTGSEAL